MHWNIWFLSIFTLSASAQTDLAITEFRYQKNSLDLRLRPVQYSISSGSIRYELFAGIRVTNQATIFSYNQYNSLNNSFRTGFRIDYRSKLDSFSLNNQIRYLRNINTSQDEFLAHVMDFFFIRNQFLSAGLRSFLILDKSSIILKKRNLYSGPSLLIAKDRFSLFLNYLPDFTGNSYDHLFIIMAIIKVNA
jgi:hypothetical protein